MTVFKENITIEKIVDQSTQHEIFKNYLTKIGVEQTTIDEIIKLDDEISSRIDAEELTNIEWEIIKFSGENFDILYSANRRNCIKIALECLINLNCLINPMP